jgi:hypothetical protein
VGAINVRDLGAVGDGRTDDAPAIQRALDEASNRGGALVFLPGAKYLLRSSLVVNGPNVSVRGEGRSTLLQLAGTAPIGIKTLGIHYTMSDLQLKGTGKEILVASYDPDTGRQMPQDAADPLRYFNTDFSLGTVALDMTSNQYFVYSCRFDYFSVAAIRMDGLGGDTYIDQCTFDQGPSPPYYKTGIGIHVKNADALMLSNSDIIRYGMGIKFEPRTGYNYN